MKKRSRDSTLHLDGSVSPFLTTHQEILNIFSYCRLAQAEMGKTSSNLLKIVLQELSKKVNTPVSSYSSRCVTSATQSDVSRFVLGRCECRRFYIKILWITVNGNVGSGT